MHIKLEDNQSFSDTFPTYIIAYCPDVNTWFVTNQRYFYYEYEDEFATHKDGVEFFKNNIKIFTDIQNEIIAGCGGYKSTEPFLDLRN